MLHASPEKNLYTAKNKNNKKNYINQFYFGSTSQPALGDYLHKEQQCNQDWGRGRDDRESVDPINHLYSKTVDLI